MLEMELKETDTIRYENIKDLLRSLQEAGFHTALDNFGVGSSFINLIADVPLNDVKLGRGFMEKCEKRLPWYRFSATDDRDVEKPRFPGYSVKAWNRQDR